MRDMRGREEVRFVIEGECASKANSRRAAVVDGHAAFIKSKKAVAYERASLLQVPGWARRRFTGRVRVILRMFYANETSDMDEQLLLDVMQDRWKTVKATGERVLVQPGVYRNDRQVRERLVVHRIDAKRPRCEVIVRALEPQQETLL
jgi:hypothetical protein